MGLSVFVVLVVLAAATEALLPRRDKAPPGHAPGPVSRNAEDLSFVLRSALAPIRGYAEILGDRVHGEDQRMARAIEQHADRLAGLAESLGTERA
jgi:nitrogen-specific signal transduction histidine kinase